MCSCVSFKDALTYFGREATRLTDQLLQNARRSCNTVKRIFRQLTPEDESFLTENATATLSQFEKVTANLGEHELFLCNNARSAFELTFIFVT